MASPAIEWTKVLIHPLGLAGYVLFTLFGTLARAKRKDERRWILPSALIAAGLTLIGGLGLAYREVDRQKPAVKTSSTPVPQQINENVQNSTSGDKSPVVQGVQGGNISINYSNSPLPQKKELKKPVPRQPAQDKVP